MSPETKKIAIPTKVDAVDKKASTAIKPKVVKKTAGAGKTTSDTTPRVAKTVSATRPDSTSKAAKTLKPEKTANEVKSAKTVKIVKVAKKHKLDMTKVKRLSPSLRIHERRMKQAARKEGIEYHSLVVRREPAKKIGN